MTKEQIQFLKGIFAHEKEDGSPLALSTTFITNDHNISNNTQDFCIFDDKNEIFSSISINKDPLTQIYAPIEVSSVSYEILFFITSRYRADDFNTVVDKQFSFLPENTKEKLKKWAHKLPIEASRQDRHLPYYTDNKTIIKQNIDKPYRRFETSKTIIRSIADFNKALENSGANLSIMENIYISEPVNIKNPLLIEEGWCLRIANKVHIDSSAKSVKFKDVTFIKSALGSNTIDEVSESLIENEAEELIFENCVFMGNGNNFIDSFIKCKKPTKLIVNNCNFITGDDVTSKSFVTHIISNETNAKFLDGTTITNNHFGKSIDDAITISIEDHSKISISSNDFRYGTSGVYIVSPVNGGIVKITNNTIHYMTSAIRGFIDCNFDLSVSNMDIITTGNHLPNLSYPIITTLTKI